MKLSVVIMFIGNVVFNALGNILMKFGSNAIKDLSLKSFASIWNNIVLNPPLISGVFCYGLSLVFYIFVLQKVDLSIAYPIVVACTAVLVNLAAQFLLHESITWQQVLGCVVIVFGIYLIVKK